MVCLSVIIKSQRLQFNLKKKMCSVCFFYTQRADDPVFSVPDSDDPVFFSSLLNRLLSKKTLRSAFILAPGLMCLFIGLHNYLLFLFYSYVDTVYGKFCSLEA